MPVARPTALTALALAVGLLLAGCGGDAPEATAGTGTTTPAAPSASPPPAAVPPAPSTTSPPASPAAPGTVITTDDSEFGVMLFDDSGQAIYLFDQDGPNLSDCYDECATEWPPVLTDGAPQVGGAADAGLLGTTQRADGSTQVTYAGHPLYTYANEGPGQVLCHNVFLNGGLWFVVTPEGTSGPV